MTQDKLIDRLKKLLALAESPVQAEAEAAMAKAQELMVRHNISIDDTKKNNLTDYTDESIDYDFMIDTKYICDLLGRFFFVRIINTPTAHRYRIIGTKENVEIAQYMRHHIKNQFHACWLAYKTLNGLRGVSGKASYYYGLWVGLSDKLTAERTRLKVEEGLIAVADPKIDEYIQQEIGKVKTAKAKAIEVSDREHAQAGHADGKKISLNAGLRSATTNNTQRVARLGN